MAYYDTHGTCPRCKQSYYLQDGCTKCFPTCECRHDARVHYGKDSGRGCVVTSCACQAYKPGTERPCECRCHAYSTTFPTSDENPCKICGHVHARGEGSSRWYPNRMEAKGGGGARAKRSTPKKSTRTKKTASATNVVMVGDKYVAADYPVRLCNSIVKAKRFTKTETTGVCRRALGLPVWSATSQCLPATAKQIRVVPVDS